MQSEQPARVTDAELREIDRVTTDYLSGLPMNPNVLLQVCITVFGLIADRDGDQQRIVELEAGLAEVLDDTAGGKALEYDEPQIICGLRQSVEQRNRALLGEAQDAE